jgi:hypothetical protein
MAKRDFLLMTHFSPKNLKQGYLRAYGKNKTTLESNYFTSLNFALSAKE